MSFGEDIENLVESSPNALHGKHSSWSRVKLGDVASITNGFAFKSKFFSDQEGAPVVRIRDILKGVPGTFYQGPTDDPKMTSIEDGYVVIGMDGDFNCRLWGGGKAFLNQRVCALKADENFYSQRFLSFALPGYLKLIHEHTSSVTVKHLSSLTVREIPLPLPPLNEQRRIVEKIESLFAQLDHGEAGLRDVQKLLSRYRQSVLKAAVTGQLTAEWRAENAGRLEPGRDLLERILQARRENWQGRGKYKEPVAPDTSDLPELPERWVWASVDQILRAGLSNGRSVRDAQEGFPVLRLTALKDGVIDISERKIGAWDAKSAEPYLVNKGDILVSRGNGSKKLVGRGGLVECEPDPVAYPDTMIRIPILLGSLNPEWFLQLWNSPFMRSQIEKSAKTTAGIYKINQTDIRSFWVPLPAIEEQVKVVEKVYEAFDRIRSLEKWCTTELTRSAALRQSILKDAFAGKLIAQDPDDEPASELLARIRAERDAAAPKKRTRKKATA
ncbi:restriction endonuclease subunit S [Halomonas dongshanensis]|uniref:Restriction endonuclease subunit S n=1 Tax=Halomonas dongshanensis TaxID=2890835 RepID=A0ABT2EDJ1_9GAMM|nr:restriction endonuclease subunit S [Halomonas dongshanensis]MCS2609661.1 restriction endonuclease subunit S [Halomonas dongshanensis]